MLLLLASLLACAPHAPEIPGPVGAMDVTDVRRWARTPGLGTAPRASPELRALAVAKAAGALVGARTLKLDGRTYRWDCSGFVEAAHARAGMVLRGSSADMWSTVRDGGALHRSRRSGRVGDVVFFDDTYDANGDGRRNDDLTHVGVVERVEGPGAYVVVHLVRGGIQRLRMDLRDPHVHQEPGPPPILRNDFLRARSKKDPWRTRYLAGELWRGFGSAWELFLPAPPPLRDVRSASR